MLNDTLFGVKVIFPVDRQNIKEILKAKREETLKLSSSKGISVHRAAAETQDQLDIFIAKLPFDLQSEFQHLIKSEQKIYLQESKEILSKVDGIIINSNENIIEQELDSANKYTLIYVLIVSVIFFAGIAYLVS